MKPKVSICIPAYKQPDLVGRALNSVLSQTFSDFEIVITDDSPDNSVANVVKDMGTNSKIKYIKNKKRMGSPENWNEAVKHASGEYIKFLHHDDWFCNEHSLQGFVDLLDKNPQANFAFSASNVCGPEQTLQFVHSPSSEKLTNLMHNPDFLFPENIIGAPSATIYRRSVDVNFDPNLKWVVDIDFYIQVLRKNKVFAYSDQPLICISNGIPTQVTQVCSGNKEVEVFEWVYLYQKISKGIRFSPRHIKFIWNLFRRYNIRSTDEVRRLGFTDEISKLIKTILFVRRHIGL